MFGSKKKKVYDPHACKGCNRYMESKLRLYCAACTAHIRPAIDKPSYTVRPDKPVIEKKDVRCSTCEGLVATKPFEPSERALYVRSQIIQGGIEHCRSLTPEQVDTILSIGDAYVKEGENHEAVRKEVLPL